MKPQSNNSWAPFFLPHKSTSFAFASPTYRGINIPRNIQGYHPNLLRFTKLTLEPPSATIPRDRGLSLNGLDRTIRRETNLEM